MEQVSKEPISVQTLETRPGDRYRRTDCRISGLQDLDGSCGRLWDGENLFLSWEMAFL